MVRRLGASIERVQPPAPAGDLVPVDPSLLALDHPSRASRVELGEGVGHMTPLIGFRLISA